MYTLKLSTKAKKDFKKIGKDPINNNLTKAVLKLLKQNGVDAIPKTMSPHLLKGNYKNCWECHIKPDLLIIWFQIKNPNEITIIRIGSHSDLFR